MGGIALTCYYCGVRFEPDQIVVKVDRSKGKTYWECDIAYYCNGHEPKGVESISAKASTFNNQIQCQKETSTMYKRKLCPCGAVFMSNNNHRKYCSKSCASKAQKNHKRGKGIKLEGDVSEAR